VPRFINFSKYARYLAIKQYTLNIFILSMCRVKISKNENGYVYTDKAFGDLNTESFFKRLYEDNQFPNEEKIGFP
jgi:hypothetical protein